VGNFFRSLIAIFSVTLLASCVNAPKRLAFDRDAASSVKTISVLEMRESQIDLRIFNDPAYYFGLIGAGIAEANRAPKANWLRGQVDQAHFDHIGVFRDRLDAAMKDRGFALQWNESTSDPANKKISRDQYGLRKHYMPTTQADGQLDVNFSFIGYAAGGTGDNTPYFPTVVVSARLLDASGQHVLFEDILIYNNIFPGLESARSIKPDDTYRYPAFDDLKAAGPTVIDGLKLAFQTTADELAKQF